MSFDKVQSSSASTRGEPVRQRVLDAAERLLHEGKAEFSMRDLASEAGVSFATPFNHFGSKAAIMHALSARRIEAMRQRFTEAELPAATADRVALAVESAAAVMLEKPAVNRAVMSWMGTATGARGDAMARSAALWRLALDDDAIYAGSSQDGAPGLSEQLAVAFRGALSFWTAGELPDEALAPTTRAIAATLLGANEAMTPKLR